MGLNLDKIKREISKYGFGYIKVELEAELDRDNWEPTPCGGCSSTGTVDCQSNCQDGILQTHTYNGDPGVICDACNGSSRMTCRDCDGTGRVQDEYNLSTDYGCDGFIKEELKTAGILGKVIYGKFYTDGSVDSEFTFTIKLEDIDILPSIVNVFNVLAEKVGNGIDVDGAGMHVAVMIKQCNGRYPYSANVFTTEQKNNFVENVNMLMPALFAAGTSGAFTRELGYRNPVVSTNKYSAVHMINYASTIEYRLFETCYQRPDAIFEYLGTIAKTLRYLDTSNSIEPTGKRFSFYGAEGISMMTRTPENVSIIKSQLKHVVPDGMSQKDFFEKRGWRPLVSNSSAELRKSMKLAKKKYKLAKEEYERRINGGLSIEQRIDYDRLRSSYPNLSQLRYMQEYIYGYSEPQLDSFIRDEVGNSTCDVVA